MSSGESFTALEGNGSRIVQYSYRTGKQENVVFDLAQAGIEDVEEIAGYTFSQGGEYLLLETERTPIYRYSYQAQYYLYSTKTKAVQPLSQGGRQRLATFSPDGQRVAFVRANNIYIKGIASGIEERITHDGSINQIINGAADWVYEEEFALTTGMQWSPDGRRLAFYRFDESRVKQFHMTLYQGHLYPLISTFKYPKAGEENALVSVHVYDVVTGTTQAMDIGSETDQYIPRIKWTSNPQVLAIMRMNRLQNRLDILLADAIMGQSQLLFTESNQYFVEPPTDYYPIFTPDGKHFIITSEGSGWNHLYLYDMNGNLVRQLTSGTDEVIDFYGYDPATKRVFFQAIDGHPIRRSVFAVELNGGAYQRLSHVRGGTSTASFSLGFKFYMHFHSSTQSPTRVTLHNASGKQLRVLEDNSALRRAMNAYRMPQREFFTFTTTEGVELNGYMIKPLDFDSTALYPVMMYQYSGPASQRVTDKWLVDWDHYLASMGYLVVCVDGRGTGGRGEAFRKITYGQLGYYETIDQIETARYLKTLPFVDEQRIGIWGWSYGGYISALALFKGSDVFRLGISVAPVTNWRFYDTIYTERYMGLPKDNPGGYDDNSPVHHAYKLRGKFLLIHGSADDNVHLQNTMELANALISANRPFEMMIYPDRNHGIHGGNTRMHLYTLMTQFVKENL